MKQFARIATLLLPVLLLTLPAIAQEPTSERPIITPEQYDVSIRVQRALNSPANDFAPTLHGNRRSIYFTSDRDGNQNIYSSSQGSGNWEQAREAGPALNTSRDEGGASITPDGRWMVFTGCERDDGLGDCDIYIAEFVGGDWRNVANLGPNVNTRFWESQPSISSDGLKLYFVSDRPGGRGGTDIWMSTRAHGGNWQPAVNLGRVVNSIGDDLAPHIAPDNATLYFSSDTHPGIGGLDIYRSKRTGDGWTSPQHLGTPINSGYDDYFSGTQLNSEDLYFASTRDGGKLNIYVAIPNPLPPGAVTTVIGNVTDARSGEALEATLAVRDIQSDEILSSFYSNAENGEYVVVLQPGRSYVITSSSPGYLFYSDRFDVPADSENDVVRKDIGMTRDIVRLLVYFDFDKATLQPASRIDLTRAVDWIKANPTVKVELAGHTDNVGAKDYNRRLSRERAQAVLEYLVSQGVSPQRLSAQGYGMDEPIASNETEDGRAMNRRVELRIISR